MPDLKSPELLCVAYIDSTNKNAEHFRAEWLEMHPGGEAILTDAFAGFAWVDNSVCTQQTLIRKGRLELLRPLWKVEA